MEQTSTPELTNAAQSDHAHPRIDYVRIFAWLAAFTVIELLVSFIPADEIKIPILVIFAILKATLVVLYYMHLRYDSRWYALVLLTGVSFALVVGLMWPFMHSAIIPLP